MSTSTTAPATTTLSETTDDDGLVTSVVRRTLLPSGLRIVTEQMAGVRSASIGVWVGVGSADEDETLHGCSHFLEHVLFKGTGSRSAMDISVALDAVGGEFNAFTAKEYTCFHARVLDVDLDLAVDVLGDMITDSLITAEDVDAERDVILDEIAMHDDDPDDVVHNLFAAQAFGEHTALGRPIAGTVESITAMTRDQVAQFHRTHYRPATIVVSVAGNVEHDHVVAQVEAAFGMGEQDAPASLVQVRRRAIPVDVFVPVAAGLQRVDNRVEHGDQHPAQVFGHLALGRAGGVWSARGDRDGSGQGRGPAQHHQHPGHPRTSPGLVPGRPLDRLHLRRQR